MTEGISIIIPTLNGGEIFKKSLKAIREQHYDHDVQLIVIDSGSSDGTLEAAEKKGAHVIKIKQQDFHHSRTRNEAIKCVTHGKVVFLVQDAIPVSSNWLDGMSNALEQDNVVAVYGKHVPHSDADLFAWFETISLGEYLGDRTLIQGINSKDIFLKMPYDNAYRIIRCDNVCAIYKSDVLNKVPFPNVVFGEDMAWAKTAILKGFKVKYDPSIKVQHSHNRPPDYRFRRTLIGTIVSASILERVRVDLSFLTHKDVARAVKILQSKQSRITDIFNGNEDYEQKKLSPGLSLLNNVPSIKKFLGLICSSLGSIGGRKQWLFGFPMAVDGRIDFVLNEVKKAFPESTNKQLLSCVEHIIATIKGTLYGDVVASYQIKGGIPPELNNAIQPFLGGV